MNIELLLLPFIGFILGFLSSIGIRLWEDYRKNKNMKNIIVEELEMNLSILAFMLYPKYEDEPTIWNTITMSRLLSTSVYDAYLDRLASLKPKELALVYTVYCYPRNLLNDCEMYKNVSQRPDFALKISKKPNLENEFLEEILNRTDNAINSILKTKSILRGEKDFDLEKKRKQLEDVWKKN